MHRDHKLAVIEAKKRCAPDTEGLGQAKRYAGKLQARFAYSTNGDGIYRADLRTGAEGYVDGYPSPQEMWDAVFAEHNGWRERFADVPFEDRGGAWEARYYQHNAIDNVLEAIARATSASSSPWRPAPARPSSPSSSPGSSSRAAGT
jgi:type I restriction enzyme, R subunit